jgi:hypothetical protein
MNDKPITAVGDFPLWRSAFNALRQRPDYGFGMKVTTAWFTQAFGCGRDSNEFAFAMLNLRKHLEETEGYYLQMQTVQEDESGLRCELWQIPSAEDHCGMVAEHFETKLRRYGQRAVQLRSKVLVNPDAELSAAARAKAEKALEIAATRLVLLRRERGIANYLKDRAPKLLEAKQ